MISSGQNIITDVWNHVAVKMKKSTGEISFFLNNSNVSFSNVDFNEFSFNSNNQPLKIGVNDKIENGSFVGEMDNMTIYDKAISHAQIEDYHSTFPILQLDTSGDTSILKADVTLGESANRNSKNQNNEQNSAYNFDGSSTSYVALSDQSYNDYKLNQFTFSAWINPTLLTQNAPLLTKSLLQGQMQFGINSSKRVFFKINNKILDDVNVFFDDITDVVQYSATINTNVPMNYYIMAFPYSKSPKQNIIDVFALTDTNNIIHKNILSTTTINESISTIVFDNGSNHDFAVVPKVHIFTIVSTHTLSDLVNNKNTLLLNRDYIISEKIVKFVSNVNEPYVNIKNISSVSSGTLTFSASTFSSVMYISNVKFVVLEDIVDITDNIAVKTFINTHGTTIPSSSTPINILKEFTNVLYSGNAFSNLTAISQSSLNTSKLYKVVVMATYSNGMSAFKVLEQEFTVPLTSLITSVHFSDTTNKLQISGNMATFDSGKPKYQIIAISKDNVTIAEIPELLEIYSDQIVKGTIYPLTTNFNNLTIPTVLVPNAYGSYDMIDSSFVNFAHVYLYCSNGIRSQDVYDKKTIDPTYGGVLWYDTAQYWRIKVLSVHGNGITSNDSPEYPDEKIIAGSYNAINHPGTFGQLSVVELSLFDYNGDIYDYTDEHVQLTPVNITLTNSVGTTYENVLELQNNNYNSTEQLYNIIPNFGLKEYINIDYTFDSPKKIIKINIASSTLAGVPIDMEVYNSQDNTNWILHSRLSYQTGSIADESGNFSTVSISDWMNILKYNSKLNSWFFRRFNENERYYLMTNTPVNSFPSTETTHNIIISENQNEYPYADFTTPYSKPDNKPYVRILNQYYSHFENKAYITVSLFSSVANIQTVYTPLVFKDMYVNNDEQLESSILNLYTTYNNIYSTETINQFHNKTFTIEVSLAYYYNFDIYSHNYLINSTDVFDYITILVEDDANNQSLEMISSKVFQATSTLKTNIATASFSDIYSQVLLNGTSSVASDSGTTKYKAIATTQPDLIPSEVETLIENYPNAVTIVDNVNFVLISKVLSPGNNNTYAVSDINYVNQLTTYLYGTDGVNRALDKKIIYSSLEQYPTSIDIQLSEINTFYTTDDLLVIYEIELYDTQDNLVPYTVSYYHPNVTDELDIPNLYSNLDNQFITNRQKKVTWNNRTELINVTFITLQADTAFSRVHVYWDTESKKNGLRIIGNNGYTLVTENGTGTENIQDYDPSPLRFKRDWLTHGKALTIARFTDVKPYVKINNVSEVTYNQLTISGTIFSSYANITSVKATAFALTANLSNNTELTESFVLTNGTDLNITANQYEISSFSNVSITNAFTDVNGTSNPLEDNTNYQIIVVVIDALNNISHFIHN